MRIAFIFFLTVAIAVSSNAQFYPEANASWYGRDDNGGPPGFDVWLTMRSSPDTLLNGTIYKRISEYNDATSPYFNRDHYVRSAPNGKGYVYLPDSAAEFLTGDLSAQTGDTVFNVLLSLTGTSWISY
ncbi:MAG: hypothetical protein IPI00_10055 [Flavobacteriales bacterium]|nr:hypothetical protein [Flavobacteriales bacterium]MBK6944306.1 hypothetical protein [Flavobacteriales bacterium]MBK7240506.1 hypothetical protein [Flavobacteriales bacterium]MBK7295198.1 hypothetical protein [Flavobacteriales bacterium]MBK9533974.1 hypothetical protein [Flavobacteriales bacterium]